MARTAPVPNIPAIPGMNPGVFVMGGGGAGGGKGGKGGRGNGDNQGANGENGGNDAAGGGRGAGSCGQGTPGGCPRHSARTAAGDPVNVATGEMFTIPRLEFSLPGLIALDFERIYNAGARDVDIGMGHGWTHTFAWQAELHGRRLEVRKGLGGGVTIPDPPRDPGDEVSQGGWRIQRVAGGFTIRTLDGFTHELSASGDPRTFLLTRVSHPNGAEIRLLRAPSGALSRIVDSVGREICFTSNEQGRIVRIHLTHPPSGWTIVYARYEYDAAGDLVAATDADGAVTRYRYDDDHRITALVYPSGLTFHYRYDAAGRCVETWGELPPGDPSLDPSVSPTLVDGTAARGIFHTKLEYGDGYTEVVDSARLLRYFVGEHGLIDKAVGAIGDVYTREIDGRGNLVALTDADGVTTRYEYDEAGRLVRETDPLGRAFEVIRDGQGRPVQTVDFGGGVVGCRYDERGNVVEVVDQLGGATTYRFDHRNLVAEKVDPDGGVTRYIADAHANLTELHMPNGGVWRWTWDYFGRPVQRVDPRGGVTRYGYSDAGKLLAIEEPGGRRVDFVWDAMSCYTEWREPTGVWRWVWGGFRWPVARIAPNGDTVRFTYNREGWLVGVTNERGETARYEHDAAGMIRRFVGFDGSWEAYKRDRMHRVTELETSAGERLEYEYDIAGRLRAIRYPDGAEHTCEYNNNDDVIRATAPGVVVEQLFDHVGNVTLDVQEVGGSRHHVASTYDRMRRRVGVRSSVGFQHDLHRGVGGALRAVSLGAGDRVVSLENDAAGFPVAERLPAGARIELDWDARLRLAGFRVLPPGPAAAPGTPEWVGDRGPSLAARYEYGADDKLRRALYSDRGLVEYEYDARGRLSRRAAQGAAPEAFRFDETDNLFDARSPAARRYGKADRLVADGDTVFGWDASGRLVEKRRISGQTTEITRFAWNAQGLLSMVVLPDGAQVEFTYDPFFRRLEKAVFRPQGQGELRLAKLVRTVWDGNDPLHELTLTRGEDGGVRQEKRTFARLENAARLLAVGSASGPDGFTAPEAWAYCVSDSLGVPLATVDERGRVVSRWSRTAWGKLERAEGDAPLPSVFPGQIEDEETGLVYNFHRYFDPQTGRYISPDPSGIAGGLNLYAYCPDPVNIGDPFGLDPHECSASFTPGPPPQGSTGHTGTWVPDSDSGRAGPNGNPVPGTTSGATNNDYQRTLRNSRGEVTRPGQRATPRQIAGAQGSNGTNLPSPNRPYSNRAQRNSHTEMHAMEWARTHFPNQIAGSRMVLGGNSPPCDVCNGAMRQFTDTNPPATIEYNWPVNNRVRYRGGQGPTAIPHQGRPAGAEAQALERAQQEGTYRATYLAQQNARTPTVDGQPNPNYNAALVDRSQHASDDNERFERRGPGQPPATFQVPQSNQ